MATRTETDVSEDRSPWPVAPITIDRPSATLRLTRTLPGGAGVITIAARNLKNGNDGVKATVMFALNGDMLAFSIISVMLDDQRTRLANKAYKRLGTLVGKLYPDWVLQRDFDLFALAVERADAELYAGEAVAGVPHLVEFYLEPYLAAGAGTILFAQPGSTKTYLALLAAVSCDAGCPVIWPVSAPVPTLFINLERSRQSLAGRLYRVNQALGLPGDRALFMINARGKTLVQVARSAETMIRQRGIKLVVLDSLSRAGGDLNDNRDTNAIMDLLNSYGGAWLAVGHTPRADAHRVFGSTMFDAAADLTVEVIAERQGQTTGVALKMHKFNDIPPRAAQLLALDFDDGGLVRVRRPRTGEFNEIQIGLAASKKVDLAAAIASVLPVGGGLSAQAIYEAVSEDGYTTTLSSIRTTLSVNKERFHKKVTNEEGAWRTVWELREDG